MWWFHESALFVTIDGTQQPSEKRVGDSWLSDRRHSRKFPEAAPPLYQHDKAHPHIAQVNRRVSAVHGKRSGFSINFVTQPAQSPDLNVDDLASFSSGLQSDVSPAAIKYLCDLLAAVSKCREDYPEN